MGSCGLGCLVLLLMASMAVHADRIPPSHSDVVSSLQDPKYKIEFHSSESPVLPTSDQETMVMTDRDGKKFQCNIPAPVSTKVVNKDEVQQNGTSTSLVADEWSSRKTPEDLLDVLKDRCFRRYEGWWIYELCYKGHLRQFHLHDKKIVQEFVLGTYDAEATAVLHSNSPNVSLQKDPRSQNAAQRYHAHVYTNGTICDLTNQPRETEVRFVCSETGRALINSIKEAPTCKYTLVFHAPMLCKHPAFQEERQPWVVIDCNAIPSDEVVVKEDTASGHLAETEAHEGSVTPALPENVNGAPLLSLPQDDAIPLSHASTGLETETEGPVKSLEEVRIHEEVTNPSQVTQKTEEIAALAEGEVKGEKEGEAQGEKEGEAQGEKVGEAQGEKVGEAQGEKVGEAQGEKVGEAQGEKEGEAQGEKEGEAQGEKEGEAQGVKEGEAQGVKEGEAQGEKEGEAQGVKEGEGTPEKLALPGHQREEHPTA
ncbi:hypothetical protein M758_6G167400 [Ceratodon purpureus]|nr:hypothetical protein M758_6G167400 [Ceratodon purpureus]